MYVGSPLGGCSLHVTLLHLMMFLEADVAIFGSQDMSFGMLPPLGALGDRRGIQGHLGALERRPWGPGKDCY